VARRRARRALRQATEAEIRDSLGFEPVAGETCGECGEVISHVDYFADELHGIPTCGDCAFSASVDYFDSL
jgi:hypothetical protein